MAQDIINNDQLINGKINCQKVIPSQECIGNSVINTPASGADAIDAAKLKHQLVLTESLALHGATPAAVRKVIHKAKGAGVIVQLKAGLVTVLASGTVTVDLLKNGTTVLSATVALNSTPGTGGTAYDSVAAAFASTTYAAGDTFEINGTVSTPSGGGGWYAELVVREEP